MLHNELIDCIFFYVHTRLFHLNENGMNEVSVLIHLIRLVD